MASSPLAARHMQNMSEGQTLEPHWGYADRALPCTSDSCEYLDLVYSAHDASMLYCAVMWAVAGGGLFLWALGRRVWPSPRADECAGLAAPAATEKTAESVPPPSVPRSRLGTAAASAVRRFLLPEPLRAVFGRTTRLQVLVLAIIAAYLFVFSFCGMYYRQWTTPAKNGDPGVYTTRTTLGPWSNRVGVLAYALTPFSILLSSRESLLSLMTGVPYQSFNFLHRWLGYIIVAQGVLHTVGWLIIELKLYQPQPYVPITLFKELYMHWGIFATFFLLLIFGLSTPWAIRLTGYEFFRKAHYVLAMVYIGACYGHWEKLSCFLIPALVLWFLDRAIRLFRSALLHYQFISPGGFDLGFRAAQAQIQHFPDADHGDVIRLDFQHPQDPWNIGQHFYICFAECSIWQSHPFTPLSHPRANPDGTVTHSYIIRAKGGETKKLAQLALKKLAQRPATTDGTDESPDILKTPLILSGSYGETITRNLTPDVNTLCIAGGTGITYVLPVLLDLISQPPSRDRKIELLWAVRRKSDIQWVEPELQQVQRASQTHGISVHVFVTREGGAATSRPEDRGTVQGSAAKEMDMKVTAPSSSSSSSADIALAGPVDVQRLGGGDSQEGHHPDLEKHVADFIADTVRGPTTVFASGPGGMVSDLRSIVAGCNAPARVWKGEERFDVRLVCDDRLEW